MKLLILAAGMGSRFGGLKQLEPIDDYGNFIIDYSIYDAIEAGFDSVVILTKEELYDDFRNTIGKRIEGKIKVEYAFQKIDDLPKGYNVPDGRVKPWGTAHAILAAKEYLNEDFAMINADDYYGKEAYKVAAHAINELKKEKSMTFGAVAYRVANTMTENGSVKRGICYANENNELTKIIESSIEYDSERKIICTPLEEGNKFEASANALVSMNLFVFTPALLNKLEEGFVPFLEKNKDNMKSCEYLIPSVLSDLISSNEAVVKVFETTAKWYGITYKQDKPEVVSSLKELVEEGKYTKGLWLK